MKKIVLYLILIATVSLGASQSTAEMPDADELQQFKQAYNNQTSEVPGFVGNIVGGEKVNFKLEVNGSNETLGVEFEGVEIANISEEGFEDNTMEVYADQEAVEEVAGSENIYDTLQSKIENGEISYSATTPGAKIKVTLVDAVRGLVDFIGVEL
jgi:hypothetical protein